jgi:menaquinone-dependent protoporphyrinogen oxidase
LRPAAGVISLDAGGVEMTKILVAYGSRHGGTRGIAERIGEVLRAEGHEVDVASADTDPHVHGADAYVVGSGVYMGSWLKGPLEFMERNLATLASKPVWLFSSGPLPGSSAKKDPDDPLSDALGPTSGPGSGGRRKIAELDAVIHARDHRVFDGAFDPDDPPATISERFVRLMPGSKGLLPPGDFRDWDAVDAWAREIAFALTAEVAAT